MASRQRLRGEDTAGLHPWAEPEPRPERLTPRVPTRADCRVDFNQTPSRMETEAYVATSVFPLDIISPGKNYILT